VKGDRDIEQEKLMADKHNHGKDLSFLTTPVITDNRNYAGY